MRNFILAFGVALASGCATVAPPPAAAVSAYSLVRSGRSAAARGGNFDFRARAGGVEATSVSGKPSDDWADKATDDQVRYDVKRSLGSDRALAGGRICVAMRDGVVELRGQVDSDAAAVRAIDDALAVGGAVVVRSALATEPGAARACDTP